MEAVAPSLAVAFSRVAAALPTPPLPTGPDELPPEAAQAAREALARGETHYTDRPGIGVLRAAVASRLTRAGFQVDPDHVLITCGVEEARFVVVQTAMPRNGVVTASDRAAVEGAVLAQGGTMGDAGAAADVAFVDLAEAARGGADAPVRDDGWMVLEAPDADLGTCDGGALPAHCIVVGSLGASSGLAGMRVGFLACSADTYRKLRDFKQALTICTTNLSQWAARAWLEAL